MDITTLLNPTLNCRQCGKGFKKSCTLFRHERNVHTKHFKCTCCDKKIKCFGRPDAYKAHLMRCKGFSEKYKNCSVDQLKITIESISSILSPRKQFKK